MSDREGLSEDDAVFTESEGERLEYSEPEDASDQSEESEAVATDEEEERRRPSKRVKKDTTKDQREKSRRRRSKRSRFVDTEAAVSEEEEEEEEEEEGEDDYGHGEEYSEEEEDDGFVDNEIEEREKDFSAAFKRRLAAHAAKRDAARKEFEEEWDPEAEEERLRQLYGRTRQSGSRGLASGAAAASTLAQVMQPASSDPKLWLVKCRPGKERAAVVALLRGLEILGSTMGIFSVLGRDSIKGLIYVEAHKAAEVINAVQKTKTNHIIFASPLNKPTMVPMNEMVDVLAVGPGGGRAASGSLASIDPSSLAVGSWVRVKRGKYVGDLAQVVEVDEQNTGEGTNYIARVKLLPRLSYRGSSGGSAGARRERPSARPFDPQEAAQYGSVTKARGYWIFNGEAYKDGFLYKDVRAASLSLGNVEPRTDELERFGVLSISDEAGGEGARQPAVASAAARLNKGEAVRITRGEFLNMTGVVEAAAEGNLISVRLDDSTFTEPVQVQARFVHRRLHIGDMVQVLFGEHEGKMGMLVSLSASSGGEGAGGKAKAVVFNPSENSQFTVPVAALKSSVAAEAAIPTTGKQQRAARGEGADGALELFDLVSVENEDGEAGVILRLYSDEQQVSILDSSGQTRKLPIKNVRKIPKSTILPGGKFDPNVFKAGDRVQVSSSEGGDEASEGRPATILHIFRTHAFLRMIDTGEILCRPLQGISRPRNYAGSSQRTPASPGRPFAAPMRHMLGKSVTIAGAGPYKGYVGIVKDLTDTHARVELHTNCKVVSVARERIMIPGSEGSMMPPSGIAAGGRTPAWGLASGKTPAWTDSRTPAWGASSSKTPAWGASSSKTPAWGASSGKTPAWGASSGKTPAWGAAASSKTPAWGAAASSKTPAWGGVASSKTPAWGGTTSSRTPAAHGGDGKTPAWQQPSNQQKDEATGGSLPPWAIPDAEVALKSAGGSIGKIVSVEPSGLLRLAGRTDPVSYREVAPSAPGKKDTVKLLNDDRALGTVIGLDGPDAVIRVDGTADFRIVPISSLVKIVRS